MNLKKSLLATGALLTAGLLAACGVNGDPLAGTSASPAASSAVIVGSANFTSSQVLGELYAGALKAKGVEVTMKPNIGSREIYVKALQDGSISVIGEYTGNLLLNFDKSAAATTSAEVDAALPKALPEDLAVLKPAAAVDQDVYVVTKAFSDANQITSLADLKKVSATSVLGGPAELEQRPYGVPGLASIYGAKFKAFEPYSSPAVKAKDLSDNKIQVATFFTTESVIADKGFVMLEDPQAMILPQNVIPLVRADVATNTAAVDAINAVQEQLTTADLSALIAEVEAGTSGADAAAAWLTSKGLG